MGLIDSLAKRFGYVPVDPYTLISRSAPAKAQPIASPPAWLTATAAAEAYSIPDRSLPEAQLELYQRLTWVQIAVSTVAGTAATTAFNVLRLTGESTEDIPNHPFELLLRRPNPLQSRAELLEATLAYFALTGNCYWWLNKVNGAPTELWVLPPHLVKPVPDGRLYLRGYIYEPEPGKEIPLEVQEVVHFRRFHPLNSFVGLSPIEALNTVATGDLAAQRWNTNFFDKDNAKIPGILGFRDPIPDPDWERMKRDVTDRYGGTKRQLMMLRGMGDGVQWINTAMSQGDMQFLEGRTFTKEEVFGMYAPGLSSMLAVNATEANSVSGKKTFIEYGVWPHLVRIAEKITNDLLPLYGPDLVGEFDDIRITDKQMELSEIAAYSQTHTVDEVRQKYYQSDALGDGRGTLLVSEVGKGLTVTGTPEDGQGANQDATMAGKKDILGYHIESGVVTRNEARADVGLPPVDDSTDSLLRDLRAKIEVVAAAKNAGLDVDSIARLVGLNGVEAAQPAPAPQPPTPPNQQQDSGDQPDHGEPDDDEMEDMPHGEMQAEGQRQGQRQAEVKALRRWLRNRGAKADPLKFRRQHLSEADVLDIAAGVKAEGEADTEQPPFTMTMDGSSTRDRWHAAVKAMQLQLDPGDEDAAERIITELERRGEASILRAFREQWRNLLPPNAETMELNELMSYINSRLLESQPAVDAIARTLYDAAGAGVNMALDELERIGIGFDYTLVNTRAQEWARQYSYELIQGINDTTKQAVAQAVERWYGNGEPLSALIDDLQPAFSKKRAKLIAATETTRASSQGNLLGYRESGVVTGLVFKTARDERVCAFCGGLDGKIVSIEGGSFYDELPPQLQAKLKRRFDVPPVHPNCRCRISAQVLTVEDAQRQMRGGM